MTNLGCDRALVDIVPAVALETGERVWLDVRGRQVPAVVVGVRAGRVQLRVQRVDRWDAVRIVRGRARPSSLSRRESVQAVDRRGRS